MKLLNYIAIAVTAGLSIRRTYRLLTDADKYARRMAYVKLDMAKVSEVLYKNYGSILVNPIVVNARLEVRYGKKCGLYTVALCSFGEYGMEDRIALTNKIKSLYMTMIDQKAIYIDGPIRTRICDMIFTSSIIGQFKMSSQLFIPTRFTISQLSCAKQLENYQMAVKRFVNAQRPRSGHLTKCTIIK